MKKIHERLEVPDQGFVGPESFHTFDENGMVVSSGSESSETETRRYFDSRIPSYWGGDLGFNEGCQKRLGSIHLGERIDGAAPGNTDTYDAFGRVTVHQSSFMGISVESRSEYDKKGRLASYLAMNFTNRKETLTEYSYGEDSFGNWILKTQRSSREDELARQGLAGSQTVRRIEYFETP